MNEKLFEDWVDKASETVTGYRVCAPLFQEAWNEVTNSDIAGIIARIEMIHDNEELVSNVALQGSMKNKVATESNVIKNM